MGSPRGSTVGGHRWKKHRSSLVPTSILHASFLRNLKTRAVISPYDRILLFPSFPFFGCYDLFSEYLRFVFFVGHCGTKTWQFQVPHIAQQLGGQGSGRTALGVDRTARLALIDEDCPLPRLTTGG